MGRGRLRARALFALSLSVAAGGAACADLFHSTDFSGCEDGGCTEAPDARPRVDAKRGRDAGSDAGKGDGSGHTRMDATVGHDGHADVHTGTDALPDDSATPDGGSGDSGHDSAPTSFCGLTAPQAQQAATHACLWLAACEGENDEFVDCYSLAIQAYACAEEPAHRVKGALFAYWDALAKVNSCAEVDRVLYPGGVKPRCVEAGASICADTIVDGGFDGAENLAVQCGEAGAPPITTLNCEMYNWTCTGRGCGLPGDSGCPETLDAGAHTARCIGTVLHLCETVEGPPGTFKVDDVGYDCKDIGAGECVADGGLAGCKPALDAGHVEDAGAPCLPSVAATCSSDLTHVIGCATGVREVVDCSAFGSGCTPDADLISAVQLPTGCNDPGDQVITQCAGDSGVFQQYAPVGGNLSVNCKDAGFATCTLGFGVVGLCTMDGG